MMKNWNYFNDLKKKFKLLFLKYFIDRNLYSPTDTKAIEFKNLFIPSNDRNAWTLRQYRSKHMSIKYEENDQLDCQEYS